MVSRIYLRICLFHFYWGFLAASATDQAFDVHQIAFHSPASAIFEANFPQTLESSDWWSATSWPWRRDSFSVHMWYKVSKFFPTISVHHDKVLRYLELSNPAVLACSHHFTSEVSWKGISHHFRFVMMGTKGDWPFLRSAYSLSCGFCCTDKCHRCDLRDTRSNSVEKLGVNYTTLISNNYIDRIWGIIE